MKKHEARKAKSEWDYYRSRHTKSDPSGFYRFKYFILGAVSTGIIWWLWLVWISR